jgi:hypothetical protein
MSFAATLLNVCSGGKPSTRLLLAPHIGRIYALPEVLTGSVGTLSGLLPVGSNMDHLIDIRMRPDRTAALREFTLGPSISSIVSATAVL